MPKLKPHKGLLKRVTVSKRGKVKYERTFASHLMTGKSGKRRRRLRKDGYLMGAEAKLVKRMVAGS
ncbi:MAG: 50S ribosomal protein L35 [Planctomycetes bacterium]|nr:50S ribosomal protein L35 [Planctomycetota bacterium]